MKEIFWDRLGSNKCARVLNKSYAGCEDSVDPLFMMNMESLMDHEIYGVVRSQVGTPLEMDCKLVLGGGVESHDG